MLGRRPKDFDIGTDAHPYQIKRLFRNCWIIGRRFRLAHIKFGQKTIEVATFRRVVTDPPADAAADAPVVVDASTPEPATGAGDLTQIHRDNTFGTPEEDAFRRDFTINGLFYDIATHAVLDYVGGLGDLEGRVVRSIGDPRVRFVEDPVRMLRAGVMAARLGFDMDPLVTEAIAEHRTLITKASPARLLEEYFKILRSGSAEATFRALGRIRLLELMTPELASPADGVWDSLARLDRYRQQFPSPPAELTNCLLIGTLLEPLGMLTRVTTNGRPPDPRDERLSFGMLPVARRDLERLRQVADLSPRLLDPGLPPRVIKSLPHRPAFGDALTWLEINAEAPELIANWKEVRHHHKAAQPTGSAQHRHAGPHGHAERQGQSSDPQQPDTGRRRRRRRRRRRGRGPGGPA
jgi:poly(A) polymerase